jgi:DNA-binding LacI/PurR family transcriptional regulator
MQAEAPMTEAQQGSARAATIYDVARAAGVSHQTVSRFLKGYEGIRPETRTRVTEALRELGYRPNLTARSLTTGRSHRVAALTHEIGQVGPSKILEAVNAAAREAGYLLDVITLDVHDPAAIRESIDLALQYDLAGVLALASTDEMARVFGSTVFRVPSYIVAVSDDEFGPNSGHVGIGFAQVIEHLTGLGHTDVLHIAGPEAWVAGRNRAREYEAAVAAAGIRSTGIIHGDWSAKSGYEAVQSLGDDLRATAILASNDQIALGAMLALRERGLSVPGDISVTGVDDIPEAAYFAPPLTTLRVDFRGEGRDAFMQLLAAIEGAEPPPHPSYLSELIVRQSTGPVRAQP